MKCKVFKKTVVLKSVSYESGKESEEEAKKFVNCCCHKILNVDDILVYKL